MYLCAKPNKLTLDYYAASNAEEYIAQACEAFACATIEFVRSRAP